MLLNCNAPVKTFVVAVLSALVLGGCDNREVHFGIPENFTPPVKAELPPPPPPAPKVPVTILAYGSVRGQDAVALIQGDNIALRFLALKQLAEAWLIPPQAALDRIAPNKGALLPMTLPPPAVGLDRNIPPIAQIMATVQALPPDSDGLTLVLDSLLSPMPTIRQPLAPQTKVAARKVLERLNRLEAVGLITPDEHAGEADALYALINSDRIAETDVVPPPPPPPPPKAKGKGGASHRSLDSMFIPDPSNFQEPKLDAKATGPAGLYLMQIPDPSQAEKAWNMLKTQSPELATMGMVLVKTDLGDVGVTWRVVAGPVTADEARKLCEGIRPKNQDCTPIPYPKNGTAPPPPKMPAAAAPAPKMEAPKAAEAPPMGEK